MQRLRFKAHVDRFYLLAPALVLLGTFVIAFGVYCALHLAGRAPEIAGVKHNELFGPFMAGFLVWLIRPLERLLLGRVAPNVITVASLSLCAVTGLAVALGHLPGAVWLYVFAGILDVLDGRLARLGGKPTAAGALFDSVSDRWGELFVFSGYAWYVHDSAWLLAVMAAIGGSMMVSYTRARAEGLGVALAGGIMQRAERIVLVAGGTLLAAYYGTEDAALVPTILGITLLACGIASTATAIHRWIVAYRELAARSAQPSVTLPEPVLAPPRPAISLAPPELRKVRPLEQH